MRRPLCALVALLALIAVLAWPGAPLGAAETTPGLVAARQAAQDTVEAVGEAETRLGELEGEIADVETELADAQSELDGLREEVVEIAIQQYTSGGADPVVDGDLNRRVRANAVARIISQGDTDTIDEFRAISQRLEVARAELESKLAEQTDAVAYLESEQERLAGELERLEELERQRIAEERRRAEEAARQAAAAEKAAEQRAAQARADQLAAREAAYAAGDAVAAGSTEPPPTPDVPVVSPPTGGGIVCPLPGSSFRDSWGEPRSGGRAHQGVDMMAPHGAPVLAPASGTVVHGSDPLGGLHFRLAGSDGRSYYGAHLQSYGQGGSVSAGTVIGYNGETGNAQGAHLHFEMQVGGGKVNPYPYVAAAC